MLTDQSCEPIRAGEVANSDSMQWKHVDGYDPDRDSDSDSVTGATVEIITLK